MRTRVAALFCTTALMIPGHLPAAHEAEAHATGPAPVCGAIIARRCPGGHWCDPRPGTCRETDVVGRCVRVSQVCHLLLRPVCGCDGRTYGNDCQRIANRVAKRHDGRC